MLTKKIKSEIHIRGRKGLFFFLNTIAGTGRNGEKDCGTNLTTRERARTVTVQNRLYRTTSLSGNENDTVSNCVAIG